MCIFESNSINMDDAKKQEILAMCNAGCKNTLMETLDISFIDVGNDFITAKMPVTPKVHQPDGILHGGATLALAETVGSIAAYVFVDRQKFVIRGLEISGNHLKSIKEGYVYATAKPIHKGRTTQLWEIKINDDQKNLISLIKFTTISLPKK